MVFLQAFTTQYCYFQSAKVIRNATAYKNSEVKHVQAFVPTVTSVKPLLRFRLQTASRHLNKTVRHIWSRDGKSIENQGIMGRNDKTI